MKTVIQVWTHKVTNYKPTQYHARWGLGDIVRGTIALYQICKKHGFNFICDIQLHPISLHLQTKKHEHSDMVLESKDNIIFFAKNAELEKHILHNNNSVILLMTNAQITEAISQDCKDFLKDVLQPKDDISKCVDDIYHEYISNPKFNIMHYRTAGLFGDQIQTHKKKNINELLSHIRKNVEKDDILITDSFELKKVSKDIIKSLNTKIAHLGYDVDSETIKDTLLDFFIMTKAQKIKYHPKNGPSGFIKIINQIYDVPLVKM